MTVDHFLSCFTYFNASPAEVRACRYLEDHGLRFLVDFGFRNAVQKMRAIQEEIAKLEYLYDLEGDVDDGAI